MLRPRITPCLLIHNGGLVKTKGFKSPKYVGDPLNAVKIFNEKQSDELIVLDIDASVKGVRPDFSLISKLASECRMPLCYGGGVTTVEQACEIIDLGVEKVAVAAAAIQNVELLQEMAAVIGKQSVVAVIDVHKKKSLLSSSYVVCTHNATREYKIDPVELALKFQDAGAGEILINSVDRDGHMLGYDLDLAEKIHEAIDVPLTVIGGAGQMSDIKTLIDKCGIVGAAAGSLFVFKGKYHAVLINYPDDSDKKALFQRTE